MTLSGKNLSLKFLVIFFKCWISVFPKIVDEFLDILFHAFQVNIHVTEFWNYC
jgi:hypothetical protein